jgi:serine/threonine protein phosphatase 1
MGRLFAIGDVHGCDTALRTLLDQINPQLDDTLVFLGDLVDRGPGTKQVLEQVLGLQQVCRIVVIRGNHEAMMLHALAGDDWKMWMQFGGDEALESYGGDPKSIPATHIELMEHSVDYWETPSTIFIHANLQPAVPLAEQLGIWLLWNHLTGQEGWYDPPRRVICGHTPQKNGYPLIFPGWVCIDTDCQRGGWLTALDVDADWVYQANEQGATRDFVLGGMA